MAITKLNSLAIPDNTIVEADLSYPLTNFSSTGIDDNATSTAITIDASQNVGIGTSSPTGNLSFGQDAAISFLSGNAAVSGIYARDTSGFDSAYIQFEGVGGNQTTDIAFATGNSPSATNATERMRILSSGGITFNGDTAAANALDDYEEGTWTPVVEIQNSTSGVTTSASEGYYVKIGKVVILYGKVTLSSRGGRTGEVNILGTPFSSTFTGYMHTTQQGNVAISGASTLPIGNITCFKGTPFGSQGISFRTQGATSTASLQASDLTDTSAMEFSVTYATD